MDLVLPMPGILDGIEKRLTNRLAEEAEQWAKFLPALSDWEDANLLENPSAELLATHKSTIEHAIRIGKILQLATEHPECPDKRLAAMVRATQQGLQDMLAMRHGPKMGRERQEQILANCFPE